MRARVNVIGLLAATIAVAFPLISGEAWAAKQHSAVHKYINPFADPDWSPARTDMGVDWIPLRPLPVLAIGDAVILGSDRHAHWPGGRIIWYQLLDGSHAGDIIYVAENLRHIIPAGTVVHAGQQIAIALPKYPWTEWGWADQWGSPRAYPCYHEGRQTNSGKEGRPHWAPTPPLLPLGADPTGRPGGAEICSAQSENDIRPHS